MFNNFVSIFFASWISAKEALNCSAWNLAFSRLVIVVLIPFLAGPTNLDGDINYKDFINVKKGENSFVYYGTLKDKDKKDTFKNRYDTSIAVLNPNSLK